MGAKRKFSLYLLFSGAFVFALIKMHRNFGARFLGSLSAQPLRRGTSREN